MFFRKPILALLLPAVCSVALRAQQPEAKPSPRLGQEDIPETARQAIEEGNEAFARKDYLQARGSYEVARKIVPDNLLLLVNLGLTEFHLGNPGEAEGFLSQAIRQRTELPSAWLVLGLIHLDAKRFERAMAAFAQVTAIEPGNARAHNYLGVAVGQMGWFDGAEAEFRRAIELDPNYADAHYNFAYFCMQRRNPAVELARRHYAKAVELGAERDPEIEARLKAPAKK